MKRIKEIILIGLMALLIPIAANATLVQITQPTSTGTDTTTPPTVTDMGSGHKALDVNIGSGSIVVSPFQINTWEFHTCTVGATSAGACSCSTASSVFMLYNGSTSATLWFNPMGTASVLTGFPITPSGVAYDHYFGLFYVNVTTGSLYNPSGSSVTALLVCGRQ